MCRVCDDEPIVLNVSFFVNPFTPTSNETLLQLTTFLKDVNLITDFEFAKLFTGVFVGDLVVTGSNILRRFA